MRPPHPGPGQPGTWSFQNREPRQPSSDSGVWPQQGQASTRGDTGGLTLVLPFTVPRGTAFHHGLWADDRSSARRPGPLGPQTRAAWGPPKSANPTPPSWPSYCPPRAWPLSTITSAVRLSEVTRAGRRQEVPSSQCPSPWVGGRPARQRCAFPGFSPSQAVGPWPWPCPHTHALPPLPFSLSQPPSLPQVPPRLHLTFSLFLFHCC